MHQKLFFLFLLFFFSACQQKLLIRGTHPNAQRLDPVQHTLENDPQIEQLISPYKEQLDSEMNIVIGQNDRELRKGKPESGLGNWVADLLHKKAEENYEKPIDFAYQNYGGLRISSLPKGEITKRHIFELMPFDNRISILTLDGPTTFKLISAFAKSRGAPVSAALRFKIKDEHPVDIMINGKAFDESQNYVVAMPDYIADGGDNADYLSNQKREDLKQLIRDVIIEFVQEERKLKTKLDKRIQQL